MIALYRQIAAEGLRGIVPRAIARATRLNAIQFGLFSAILPFRIRVLRTSVTEPVHGEVIVFSVLRNGQEWLHTFLAHYRELGVRTFVILDNGSTDGSVDLLLSQPDVVLLTCDAPYRFFENTFKRHICDRFGKDRWCLLADVDELLAYPGMERRSLDELAQFAEVGGYDAVVCHMLDLYPAIPIAEMADGCGRDLREDGLYFESQDIARQPYAPQPGNVVPEGLEMYFGGVRRRVFGTTNGLSKVSLFRNAGRLRPFVGWHHASHARLAAFTIALLHLPFNRAYRDRVMEAAQSGRYGWLTDDEYAAYAKVARENPLLSLMSPASRRYAGPDQLRMEGFVKTTPAYEAWAAGHD